MSEPIKIGAVIEVAHPFIRDTYTEWDSDGPCEMKTWRPGTRGEPCGPEDFEMVAEGIGTQIITVVSTHKPGRFPERVFFTRKWRDPNGREFGKGKLHITVAQAFRRLIKGYRHEYRVIEPRPEPEPMRRLPRAEVAVTADDLPF